MTSKCSAVRYGRLAAIALGALISANSARADVIQNYDFSGTLTNAINGSTSVTATFSLDFTTQAVTAFDFTTPVGTIGPSDFFSDLLSLTATTPNADIVELAFTDKGGAGSNLLWLVFETNLASFSTDTSIALYTGLVSELGVTDYPITTLLRQSIPFRGLLDVWRLTFRERDSHARSAGHRHTGASLDRFTRRRFRRPRRRASAEAVN